MQNTIGFDSVGAQGSNTPVESLSGKAKPSLVINAVSNWIALGVNLIVGFLLIPYIIKRLGVAEYGIWTLIISIIGYYGLLDMGVTAAIMRYVARYAGQKDYRALNEAVNTALSIFAAVGCLVIVMSVFAAEPLARFFNIESGVYMSFKWVVWLLGITTGFTFTHSVLGVVILAHERFVIGNTIRIILTVLRAAASVTVLYYGGGLIGLGWVYAGIAILAITANLIVINLYFKHVKIRIGKFNKTLARALLSFGFFSFVIKIGMLLRTKLGAVVIGKFLDMDSVGVYGVSALLFAYLARLTISCSGVTQPRLAALAGQDSGKIFADVVLRYSVFVANFTVGTALVAFLLCKDFLRIWLPENFKDINTTAMAFYILVFGLVPNLISGVSSNALEALKKHPYCALQTIIEMAANLILSVLLVVRFGIIGVAIGIAIPAFMAKLVSQSIYCCIVTRMNWFNYMAQVFIKPFLLAGFLIWVFKGSGILFDSTSYLQLVLKGLVVFCLYSLLAYFFCFDNKNRQMIKTRLKFRNFREIAVTDR
ncbi:MAG: oligosaccharide flippase family protein [Planctomycetota bacterium]|jgi:O-antigen/teichoic acid export membrane protein